MASLNGPRLWFVYHSGSGIDWDVYLGTPEQFPQLEGRSAVTLPDSARIIVDASLPPSVRFLALVHEVCHAEVSAPGDPTSLASAFGCSADEVEATEERFIAFFAPRLAVGLLRNAGLQNLPKVPR